MELFSGFELEAGEASRATGTAGAGATYYPTLLIGLGGTGAEVLLRVKKLLREMGGSVSGDGGRTTAAQTLHRFLFIDTDRRTFAGKPGYPAIEQTEQCFVGVDQIGTLLEHPKLHPQVWKRFPPQKLQESYIRNLAQGIGAGQIRSLGALAFVLDFARVRTALTNAFNDLVKLAGIVEQARSSRGAKIGDHVVVYLVGSLNGGTGSGCFLDAALLARHVCQAKSPKLVGMFALPNASFDEAVKQDQYQVNRIRANAYSALKELQLVLDADAAERSRPLVYAYGEGNELRLGKGDRVFHAVYLVDDHNAMGRLSRIDDLCTLMARSVFQDVGSSFGASAASFESNNQVLTQVELCRETGRPRLFGTVATSALVYPAERVARYATLRLLDEVLSDGFLGAAPPLAKLEGLTTAFLKQNQLDDRGASNQILDALLLDGTRNEILSASALGLPSSWGAKLDKARFAAAIEQKRDEFEKVELPRVKRIVAANAARLKGADTVPPVNRLAEAVESFALDVAASQSAGAARAALDHVREVTARMRDELAAELDRWSSVERASFLQEFNDARDELTHVRLAFLRSKDETLRAKLINRFNDLVTQELWATAKPTAIDLVDALLHEVQEQAAQWGALAGDIAKVRDYARRAHRGLETHAGSVTESFVVEQEVTRPGYERRYYDGLAGELPGATAFARIFDELGGAEAMYRWMLDLGSTDRVRHIGNRFGGVLFSAVAPPLRSTNLVEFVRNHPEEAADGLDVKLSLTFEMCQPFWGARPVSADTSFPEFLGLSVTHAQDRKGHPSPPREAGEWIKKHSPGAERGRYEILHADTPYEITLGRRTYGARAYYLSECRQWQGLYQVESAKAQGKFMLESHTALAGAPDLFPQDQRPFELFALGMALGFIVTRGDWYYYNLERTAAGTRVLYASQAPTAFTIDPATPSPATLGEISFELGEPKKWPTARRLAQGRGKALEALRDHPDWLDAIEATFDAYHQAAGSEAVKSQLGGYVRQVLEPASTGEDQLAREAAAIVARIETIGR